MITYIRDVKVIRPDGVEVTIDVEIHSRPNSDAFVELFLYKGRRITPYEQRLKGWKWTLNAIFKRTYSDRLADLISEYNPLLALVSKSKELYHKPVILGIEHGVIFMSQSPQKSHVPGMKCGPNCPVCKGRKK